MTCVSIGGILNVMKYGMPFERSHYIPFVLCCLIFNYCALVSVPNHPSEKCYPTVTQALLIFKTRVFQLFLLDLLVVFDNGGLLKFSTLPLLPPDLHLP